MIRRRQGEEGSLRYRMRQCCDIHVAGAENMEAEGNILDHEFEIHEGRKRVAEVSKK